MTITLASRISKEFSKTIKPTMIFEFPSIKTQSNYLTGNVENEYQQKNIEIDEKIKSKKKVSYKRLRD